MRFYWNTVTPVYLHVADGHFCATVAEMSSYRDPAAQKT